MVVAKEAMEMIDRRSSKKFELKPLAAKSVKLCWSLAFNLSKLKSPFVYWEDVNAIFIEKETDT